MNFCPNCGSILIDAIIDETNVKKCKKCNFVDWNNWVNISCVVVAYNKNNEFLMVVLKGKETGKITFPGGYRNLGETLEEAAKREFYEETGMFINQIELFKIYTKDEQRLVWIVYKAKVDEMNQLKPEQEKN
jgi:ADP-ribose pyrophosphatase YjhB (NUDIX family)